MTRLSARGFGFKLDYDKEIAADEKLIAQLGQCIANRWFHPMTMVDGDGKVRDISTYAIDLAHLALTESRVAEQLVLSLTDRADLASFLDRDIPMLPDAVQPGAYLRGQIVYNRLRLIVDSIGFAHGLRSRRSLAISARVLVQWR